MEASEINKLIKSQQKYFQSGNTLPIKFRIKALKKLKEIILKYENDIADALKTDLGKSEYESYMCETGMVLSELSYMIKHTKKFAKAKRVHTPLAQFSSKSYIKPCPYGNVLIMSPWNYPFLLTMDPLIDAIAAGNTIIVKPSAYSPATSLMVKKIIEECFDPDHVATVMGGRKENSSLLSQRFDFVFFTGSAMVGKEVLKSTAEHLTPVVLELGGKSPCIVDNSAKIKLAAKRIVFGKFLNCGQTCVAPDYILCQKSIKEELLNEIKYQIKIQYSNNALENSDYGKIINQKHFDRLLNLIDHKKVVFGGQTNSNTLQIAPTVLDNVSFDDAVMQEEIFGPIMPILTFDTIDDVIAILSTKPSPLALYLFSESKNSIKKITEMVKFGGGCINDTIIHLATSEMGFGGVGESGMGSYHGKKGFEAFSHFKSIVNKKTWIDLPMRYQPYKRRLFSKLLHLFLK